MRMRMRTMVLVLVLVLVVRFALLKRCWRWMRAGSPAGED